MQIFGIVGIPEVMPEANLAQLLAEGLSNSSIRLAEGDILVVTSKIVSKAEGRVVELSQVKPSLFAMRIAESCQKDPRLVELVLSESRRIVRMDHGVLITQTRHGVVCANAGVDRSNAGGSGRALLLPENPDSSAIEIREQIQVLTGISVAVIISDSFGRPWRKGTVGVAIGMAGLVGLVDFNGQIDADGRTLRVSQQAVADELASAGELVMGKLDRIPAALVRECPYREGRVGATDLVRSAEEDLFR